MWRSVAAAVSRNSKLSDGFNIALHSQPKVLNSNTPKHVAPQLIFQPNLRFFSQDSSTPIGNEAHISEFEPVVSGEVVKFDVFSNAHHVFDEMSEENKEGKNLIGFVKLVSEKDKLALTTTIVEALDQTICIECKRRSVYALSDLLKEMVEDGSILTMRIFNGLISLLSVLSKGKSCYKVFNKFKDFNCVPNGESLYFTIEALCRRFIFDWAFSVCEIVGAGILLDPEIVGSIFTCLCKGKKAKYAYALYLFVKKQDKIPPKSSISSLCHDDVNVSLALEMLNEVSKEERKYAVNFAMLQLKKMFTAETHLRIGKLMIFGHGKDRKSPLNLVVITTIVN